MAGFRRRFGTASSGSLLLVGVGSLAGVGLLLWAALWFGLSSQCGGGYGECTFFRRVVASSLAVVSVLGAAGMGLLAVYALLRAAYLTLQRRTGRSTVVLVAMALFLIGGAVIVARTSAGPLEVVAYGLLLLAVSATTARGISRSRSDERG